MSNLTMLRSRVQTTNLDHSAQESWNKNIPELQFFVTLTSAVLYPYLTIYLAVQYYPNFHKASSVF